MICAQNERKKKKSGAATGHAQLAERLLAAHMRREALNHSKGKERTRSGDVPIGEGDVYLEDVNP
jgi:DNA excision repair protein ERCC-5